jgi:RNA polymerase sigma-70 factor, ECF subfamily
MSSLSHQQAPAEGREDVTAARVEELYTSHAGLVRSICRSLLRDRVEAEDAVQQTFLSAQRALLNGSSPRHAEAWLATIARHESLARVRARMRDPLPLDTEAEEGGPDAYAGAVKRHEVGELRDALAELPAQQREAILMREVRGFSYEEVALALAVTPAAVESLLFRARRRLQVRLREALATLSPGLAFRDLATRLGGGFAAPTAAKAIAVGVGAAVITGGALVGPRMVGRGQAHATPRAPVGRTGNRPRASASLDLKQQLSADSPVATPTAEDARTRGEGHDGASTSGIASSSDGRNDTSTTADGSNSGSTSSSRSDGGDTQTTSSGSGGTSTNSDGGGTQTTSSGSGETSTTSDGGSSGSDGGTQTTSSGGDGGTDSGH